MKDVFTKGVPLTLLPLLAQLSLTVYFPTSRSGWVLLIIAISLLAVARKWPERDVAISPLLAWTAELVIFFLGVYRFIVAPNRWVMSWSVVIMLMGVYELLGLWLTRHQH
ncbi:hypothetical protein [Lactiplantibacillus carotarum]|uniref:hypothetical protein n=1 Tax=Lactiplantibacillus carotarum TaxID=2993456 RepID=UPI00298F16B0|nr:hypothetical protein [Lactiplantibacillus carotarum]